MSKLLLVFSCFGNEAEHQLLIFELPSDLLELAVVEFLHLLAQ